LGQSTFNPSSFRNTGSYCL